MKTIKSNGGRFISADEMKEIVAHSELANLTARVCKVENELKDLQK